MKLIFILLALLHSTAFANFVNENLKVLNWNGLEVKWLQDEQSPTFELVVQFHEGAGSEKRSKSGITSLTFDLLTTGTSRYKQSEILDHLEYFGARYSSSVTHEFAQYYVEGLTKDSVPVMKKICHIFSDAQYPKKNLEKAKARILAALANLPRDHKAVADRAFRFETMKGTAYALDVGGRIQSISKIRRSHLLKKLSYFKNDVKKTIYIRGSSKLKELESVISKDCGWKPVAKVSGSASLLAIPNFKKRVIYIPVAANQTQIRIGSYMSRVEARKNIDLDSFVSALLGSGFTSRLNQEIRVKRGLTYSISTRIGSQKGYGRKWITTSTKADQTVDMLKAIESVIKKSSTDLDKVDFLRAKTFVKGNYLFSLESNSAFLNKIIYLDHMGLDYSSIYEFPNKVDLFSRVQVMKRVGTMFDLDKSLIIIVGPKSVVKGLRKAGYEVRVRDVKRYL